MRGIDKLRLRIRSLLRRDRVERELDREMRFHLEQQIEENLAAGMQPEEARRQALRTIGNIAQFEDECRDMRGLNWIDNLAQDLRYAARGLRKSPGFTSVAVVSLALGIGANTAIFSVVDALLVRKLPVLQPERLFTLARTYQGDGAAPHSFNYRWYERFRDLGGVFSGATAIYAVDRGDGGSQAPEADARNSDPQIRVRLVTGNYFSVMGVNTRLGRTFTEADDRDSGSHAVAVISHGYWERRFALAGDIIGRTIRLGRATCTIIGVTPPEFTGEWIGRPADVWVPVALAADVLTELPPVAAARERGAGLSFYILARLNPGIREEQARAAAQLLYQQILNEERGGSNPSPAVRKRIAAARLDLEPGGLGFSPQRQSFAQPVAILMCVVGLVMLIACANVSNLLLARASSRNKEIALRRAIGAGRGRIIRQLLTESVLLAAIGGALGLVAAYWGTGALANAASSGVVWQPDQQLLLDLHPDARVFAFAAGLSLAVGILFGLAPAFRLSSAPALSQRSGALTGRSRVAALLISGQVALSLVLLIGAGLLTRTLRNLRSQDMGLDRERVLLVWTALRQSGRLGGERSARLFEEAQQRLSAVPGIVSASASTGGLLLGRRSFPYPVKVQGRAPGAGEQPMAQSDIVMPRFFETAGMRLLLGRDFSIEDAEAAPRVVIVNESLARHFFGSEGPLGRRIGFGYGATGSELEIVGVVSDAVNLTPYEPKRMMFYIPYRQDIRRLGSLCLVVRTSGNPTVWAASVRQELRRIDASLPVLRINTIEGQLDDLLVQETLIASLSGIFASLAILLACIGLHGVIAYNTRRRTQEIGIRLALGATRRGVLAMVLRESLWPVLAGIAFGVPAALAAARAISSRLFGVSSADPLNLAAATVLMVVVAMLAVTIPARRASKVDPMEALRYE